MTMDGNDKLFQNLKKDDTYEVVEILSDNNFGRTEKVISEENETCIRKYIYKDISKEDIDLSQYLRLANEFLPKTYDVYSLDDADVLIQEYVSGIKLSDLIQTTGGLSLDQTTKYIFQLANAVDYLHSHLPLPIIHRDIKPDNIIITNNGILKLVDFGAARKFDSSKNKDTIHIGTPGYAPPEQFGFGQTDTRSDIYSIGMTILHMLTGVAPIRGNLQYESLHCLGNEGIKKIIIRATQFDPNKRYNSIKELLYDINLCTAPSIHALNSQRKRKNKVGLLKPTHDFLPAHRKWPLLLKILLVPIEGLLFLGFPIVIFSNMFSHSGFSMIDDIIESLDELIVYFFVLIPAPIFMLNLFNVGERFAFFKTVPILKKVLIVLILFILAAIIMIIINQFHTEAYLLNKNSANS